MKQKIDPLIMEWFGDLFLLILWEVVCTRWFGNDKENALYLLEQIICDENYHGINADELKSIR